MTNHVVGWRLRSVQRVAWWCRVRDVVRASVMAVVLIVGLAPSLWGQLVVFDPTVYSEALQQFAQLEQQYRELVLVVQQIRAQYQLLLHQSQMVPVAMNARYRSVPTPWLAFAASDTYGTTNMWIQAANNGHDAVAALSQATSVLGTYGGAALGPLSSEEAARIHARYDRVQLADGSLAHGLEALGFLRGHQQSVEQVIRNLEDDSYSTDPEFNTEIAVLNKINATGVATARIAKDTTNVLISLLEQQLLEGTERREAAVEAINAHIAFETEARSLLAQTTAQTTEALTTFRIP